MTPSRDRLLLGILSIIIFISTASLVFFFLASLDPETPSYTNLSGAIISIFNISILFALMAFGEFGGTPFAILACGVSSWLMLRTGRYEFSIYILPFIVTTFVGYAYLRIKHKIDQIYNLKCEKLNEEVNVLSNNILKDKGYVRSLEYKLTKYSALKEIAESLSTDLSLDNMNNMIIKRTEDTLGGGGRMLLFLVDIKKQELMLSASNGMSKVKTKKGDVFDHWVLRHRKSLIIEDIAKDFRFSANDIEEAKENFRSLIETPLVNENKVIGLLRMDNTKESIYSHDDLRVLDIIADLGAVAVQNAMLYARTQELAIKDGLTGLTVRRYFMERFQEELKRAARKKEVLSVLILDIDHFKDYNDQYGHTAGDLVLRYMARTISSMMKEDDILARYGGEEIAILLFGAEKARAVKEAEEIRKKIEAEPLMLRRYKAHLTVSIGVASYPEDAVFEEELIKMADDRLYKAKAAGRNRVCAD